MNRNFNHCSFLALVKKKVLFPLIIGMGGEVGCGNQESAWKRKDRENYGTNNRKGRLSCSMVWLLQQREDGAGTLFTGWISILTGPVLSPEVQTTTITQWWSLGRRTDYAFFFRNIANFIILRFSITSAIHPTWSLFVHVSVSFITLLWKNKWIVSIRRSRK